MRKLLLLLLIMVHPVSFADNYDGTLDVFESSPELQPYFDNAYGYAVFPTVGRGGIVVGGSYGKGRVYENGRVAGYVSMAKVSIGFQLGGQVFSELIFLQDKRAFDEFISGRFEFDASASAVVIILGAQAQAGTAGSSASAGTGPASTNQVEYGYNKGMAVFLHPLGGLMYEASIGGQKFKYTPLEKDAQIQ
jgi:lipid-binding SYLF domain-containing protein